MIPPALAACAPNVSPVTLERVIARESGGQPYAVNVNGLPARLQPHPASASEAVSVARVFIARGFRVDLGLMQITDRNLPGLGYSLEQIFDPCTNIQAGGAILTAGYITASRQLGEGQPALKVALSIYNTGTTWRGFANGYVAGYYRTIPVPALTLPILQAASVPARGAAPMLDPYTADTAIFTREALNVSVE